MKILITGASGLLGRALMKELTRYQPIGTAYSRADNGLIKVDLCDAASVDHAITQTQPDIIIHAAAERRPDVSQNNPEAALALNVAATEHLAKLAKQHHAWLLYISTDYVFDGTKSPYRPQDLPNPVNFYGQSKWQGEQAIWQITHHAGVLRIPILYGPVEYLSESAVTALLKPLLEKVPHPKIDNWGIRYPTLVDDIAVVCRQLAERAYQQKAFSGIWHWSNDQALTKYEMVKIMADILSLPTHHIIAINQPEDTVPRPYQNQFDCSDLISLGIGQKTDFTQWMKQHLMPLVM